MAVNFIFALVMSALGAYSLIVLGLEVTTVLFALIILTLFMLVVYGIKKEKAMLVGGANLGLGILTPTSLGIIPMIIGFVCFILLTSLQFWVEMEKEQ